jgi:predicted DNA-binding transcriptional regulator YafY
MRADRLLSILMILQTRGRATAQELADELEVSERTIYRDMVALSTAGVPVYTERGPGGGCALVDSYRTTLTGLKEEEVHALFMLSIPTPLAELGVSQELKAALLKLSASLPSSRRQDVGRVRQRVHLDWEGWFQEEEPLPHLQTIHQAVWRDKKLSIVYRLAFDTRVERVVDPYGLVAKASTWYLVYHRDAHLRVLRVSQILEAQVLAQGFNRPSGFDLLEFWEGWCKDYELNRPSYPVTLRVVPDLVPFLARIFGDYARDRSEQKQPDKFGRITLRLQFETLEAARGQILGLGKAVEVLEPLALRYSVLDFAEQVVNLYST